MELQEAIQFYPSFTQEDIAALTGLPIHTVRRTLLAAGFEVTNKLSKAWQHEILATTENMNVQQAMKMHSTTYVLIYHARYKGPHKEPKVPPDHLDLVQFITENRHKMTQAEMAEAKGVSQSLISKLNPYRHEYGKVPRKTEGEWLAILDYARKNNVQQAANRFGVSRTAIHKRLDK